MVVNEVLVIEDECNVDTVSVDVGLPDVVVDCSGDVTSTIGGDVIADWVETDLLATSDVNIEEV